MKRASLRLLKAKSSFHQLKSEEWFGILHTALSSGSDSNAGCYMAEVLSRLSNPDATEKEAKPLDETWIMEFLVRLE